MKNPVAVIGAFCAMLCLVLSPTAAIDGARYGLTLCAELIVPSLLPFFMAGALLIRLGVPQQLGRALAPLARRLWGVSGTGASAFLAGICGGYPLGAQTVAELYGAGQVSREEAGRLLRFVNNSGPSFLIGVIGVGIFSSRAAGLCLYAIHVTAAAIVGALFRKGGSLPSAPVSSPEQSIGEALVGAVRQAVAAVLSVSGFVVCFCVLSGLLDSFGVWSAAARILAQAVRIQREDARALLIGMLELSGGIGALRGLEATRGRFVLATFLSGWGGLSVHLQSLAVLADTDLDGRPLLIGRLLSALISAFLAAVLCRFIPPLL